MNEDGRSVIERRNEFENELRASMKPCPFCGGKPYLETSSRAFVNGTSTRVTFVRCIRCNARGNRVNIAEFGKSTRSIDAEQKAVHAWNRRV